MTAAYDLLSDKDKRARYDRGEIDEDGNPSEMLLSAKAERLANWRLLQDLAGVREPAGK